MTTALTRRLITVGGVGEIGQCNANYNSIIFTCPFGMTHWQLYACQASHHVLLLRAGDWLWGWHIHCLDFSIKKRSFFSSISRVWNSEIPDSGCHHWNCLSIWYTEPKCGCEFSCSLGDFGFYFQTVLVSWSACFVSVIKIAGSLIRLWPTHSLRPVSDTSCSEKRTS